MSEILITEIFKSIQGEGLRVGCPSIFIRSFACNLQCRAFGQPDLNNLIPIKEMPHNTFDASDVDSVADLPVFPIGCDSSAAWNKKYRHLATRYTPQLLRAKIVELIPNEAPNSSYDLVITGGEPLLEKQQSFWEILLYSNYLGSKIDTITFETNGTQMLQSESLFCGNCLSPIIYSISPKLSNSGEDPKKSLRPDVIWSYINQMIDKDKLYLKFVVRDHTQLPEIYRFLNDLGDEFDYPIYLMPEGGTLEGIAATEQEVCQMAMDNGWRFSPRLHIQLFGNRWGT